MNLYEYLLYEWNYACFLTDHYNLYSCDSMIHNNVKLNQERHVKSKTILIAYSIYEQFEHMLVTSRLRKNAIYIRQKFLTF